MLIHVTTFIFYFYHYFNDEEKSLFTTLQWRIPLMCQSDKVINIDREMVLENTFLKYRQNP